MPLGPCTTCGDVFFDNLNVRVTSGKLKEETHYYPFGLPMKGMGTDVENPVLNRQKYQSNEYIKELGLNWMSFGERQYDPQLGRFLSVDPLADGHGQQIWSPYSAMGNAPESMIDPNGTYAMKLPTGIRPGRPDIGDGPMFPTLHLFMALANGEPLDIMAGLLAFSGDPFKQGYYGPGGGGGGGGNSSSSSGSAFAIVYTGTSINGVFNHLLNGGSFGDLFYKNGNRGKFQDISDEEMTALSEGTTLLPDVSVNTKFSGKSTILKYKSGNLQSSGGASVWRNYLEMAGNAGAPLDVISGSSEAYGVWTQSLAQSRNGWRPGYTVPISGWTTFGKTVGKVSTGLGVLSLGKDAVDVSQGKMSGARFIYHLTAFGTSAYVGAQAGGLYGAAAGIGFTTLELGYDNVIDPYVVQPAARAYNMELTSWLNNVKAAIMRGY
jgi:RHS repeat-associated protein